MSDREVAGKGEAAAFNGDRVAAYPPTHLHSTVVLCSVISVNVSAPRGQCSVSLYQCVAYLPHLAHRARKGVANADKAADLYVGALQIRYSPVKYPAIEWLHCSE